MEANQPMAANAGYTTVDVKSFGSKFGTKAEIYRFLTVEAGIFLPDYHTVTAWHMKDLCSGEKTVSTPGSLTRPALLRMSLRCGQAGGPLLHPATSEIYASSLSTGCTATS